MRLPSPISKHLILPPSVARNRDQGRKVLCCTVPGCRAAFGLDQEEKFTRHVRQCSEENSGRIEEIIAKHRETVFARPADKEMYDWYREGKS